MEKFLQRTFSIGLIGLAILALGRPGRIQYYAQESIPPAYFLSVLNVEEYHYSIKRTEERTDVIERTKVIGDTLGAEKLRRLSRSNRAKNRVPIISFDSFADLPQQVRFKNREN